ncbi:hypothetical protein HYPBUDRAFT_153046 [Hyphopichia burtonii NRRL Y-1933]|uniref:Uncharacterized protein n=1 Tax=Hyphopichia burtonii NRRL Y-1933 TaxID=984485 RepID=A0A1E4RIP4_9ASCO|nr:hypothetical protein HYPBUDRAFT_153046 [Hyphopichia burtonii NRRL Y-1933]ODV67137.1 hypothetical protein HYPBUDRAFT_153046 [Hyphopichia burtonii NRRL Y-1933]
MPSATLEQVISNARALVQSSQSDKALEILSPLIPGNENNVFLLQIFGEVLLETNDLETAYEVLTAACELDPEANAGTEKFFYLGQIIGGNDGLKCLDTGLSKLNNQLSLIENNQGENDQILVDLSKIYKDKESLIKYLIKKLNQGIFAKIEIWMTDLCMEPEAEQQCNDLISYSLRLDGQNPEALSLLASIRISQQKPEEAKDSLLKSWELFHSKKAQLEESANKIQNESSEVVNDDNADAFEVGVEYIELIQPLLTLARFAIELELYELAMTITSNTQDINEDILDAYYYEAFANILSAKKIFADSNNINKDQEDYRDLDLKAVKTSKDENIKQLLDEAKSLLTQGFKIINSDIGADSEPELVEQVNDLLNQLGGPSMADLMPQRRNEADEEGWEDEINSDEEN